MKMETAYQNLCDASSSKRKIYSNKHLIKKKESCQVINLTLHFKKIEKPCPKLAEGNNKDQNRK